MNVKTILRKIIPVRSSVFASYRKAEEKKLERIDAKIANLNSTLENFLYSKERSYAENLSRIEQEIQSSYKKLDCISELQHSFNEQLQSFRGELDAFSNTSLNELHESERSIRELVWAEVFASTIAGSDWYEGISISPGRWGVGYPVLYILFRALEAMHPKSILELGLGQSTKMISRYTATHEEVHHYVVENDASWIDFFEKENRLTSRTEIVQLNAMAKHTSYAQDEVRVFEGFTERFKNAAFDFILIDGPIGGDMKEISRIDLIDLVPDVLEKSFAIFIDDHNRKPEQNMCNAMRAKLESQSIEFVWSRYAGEKEVAIICSKDLTFLTTL